MEELEKLKGNSKRSNEDDHADAEKRRMFAMWESERSKLLGDFEDVRQENSLLVDENDAIKEEQEKLVEDGKELLAENRNLSENGEFSRFSLFVQLEPQPWANFLKTLMFFVISGVVKNFLLRPDGQLIILVF